MTRLASLAICLILASASQAAQIYDSGNLGWSWPSTPGTTPRGGFLHTFTLGPVQSVDEICLDISHTWSGDLDIWVNAPGYGTFDFDLMLNETAGVTGNFDLGLLPGSGALANVATYVFSGVGPNNWVAPHSVAGNYNANAWQSGPFAAGVWSLQVFDNVNGEGGSIGNLRIKYTPVPEPSSLGLLLIGLAMFRGRRRSR
jgi:hypothetical protein